MRKNLLMSVCMHACVWVFVFVCMHMCVYVLVSGDDKTESKRIETASFLFPVTGIPRDGALSVGHYSLIKLHMCMFIPLYRGPLHRERRRYLRTALSELISLISDSPGLLGPKVCIHV